MTVDAFFKLEDMKPKDYKSDVPTTWCPGCGHFGILNGTYRAMAELGIDPAKFVAVSGIGCSSRMPYFVDSYKMHTLHGRAGAVATGTQVARPDLCVVVAGGDGDGFSIGGGHMPHMARKNVNMTYILMDNGIYGLTKGQYSPTSRPEMTAYTTPYGGPEQPMDPITYMLAYGATYVAQAFAGKPKDCAALIKGAMEHEGFAYVNIFSQCPTFNKIDTIEYYRDLVEPLPEDHDVTDMDEAMRLARRPDGKARTGLFYQVRENTLDENLKAIRDRVGGSPDYDMNKILDLAKP
uniref:2-oxoglutarate synthase, beta subunit KorB n=1 Tax=Magnetococcus massalia (strain MO-1) TaxID=451514 RepID=A0A1S7LFS4_MAGMO|nr:2-oxoglutarate synthase, beta subunit KorB [Candidatus Magnetococcus massalia]CRH06384.1 Pyruvate ferredoxin/flavodoxin oxidoreductase, beta subunit [Candidatus Magnetococcus massalia]